MKRWLFGAAMYVCHCKVVSDRSICDAIAAGARDIEGVTALCGAGGACSGCHPAIEHLLADAAAAIRSPRLVRRRQAVIRRDRVPSALLGTSAVAS